MDSRVVLSKLQDSRDLKPLLENKKSKELLWKVEKIFTATTMDHQGLKEVISVLGSYCVGESETKSQHPKRKECGWGELFL